MSTELVNALYHRGHVRLIGRGGREIEVDYPDVFFLRTAELDRLPNSWSDCIVEQANGFARVRWPEEARGARKARLRYFYDSVFQPRGIEPLEADVSPVQRFLVEHPQVRMAQHWRLLYFDLETEKVEDWDRPWRAQILSFSWRSSEGPSGHVRVKARDSSPDEPGPAERAALLAFVRLANRHDVLLAWNGDGFDFKVVQSRLEMAGIPFDPYLYHWLDHLRLFKRYYQRTEDGAVKQSFALNSIAEALLGERKVPVEPRARALGWDGTGDHFSWTWENGPDLLREYNDFDVELMTKLEERTSFVELHLAVCDMCRVLPSAWSLFPMTHVDGKMLQRGFETGYHFPSKPIEKRPWTQAKGAYVPEADVGLHEGIAVLDYSKMYPSIIRSFNMSLETIHPDGELRVPETDEQGRPTGRTVAAFRAEPEGHLPAALTGILATRQKYDERRAAAEVGSPEWHDAGRLSTACKILANVFYGVVLSSMSRLYKKEIGESVTSMGRYLLAATIRAAEAQGHKLVFGDTDSVAIRATSEQADALKRELNGSVIPGLLARAGISADRSSVEIDYEKRFRRIVVTASKRYAGKFDIYKGKPADPDAPMEVRGLEIVRSDVCPAARRLQRSILELVLGGEAPERLWKIIREERDGFWGKGVKLEELILSKGISKPLDAYRTKPHQVRVAERMRAKGMEVGEGSKIPYLMTLSGPVHPSELETEESLDRLTYWNKYVYPPSARVLEASFPGRGWADLYFQRGEDPDQLPLFERRMKGDKPKRPVRRVRRVERPKASASIALRVRGEVDVSALTELLKAYAGPCSVSIVVELWRGPYPGHWADVEMSNPDVAIVEPDKAPKFAEGLRALGVRWEVLPETVTAPGK